MGHANVQTTMQYLHYVPRPQDANLVGKAFATGASGGDRALGAMFDDRVRVGLSEPVRRSGESR
jgi:hypothetical protein